MVRRKQRPCSASMLGCSTHAANLTSVTGPQSLFAWSAACTFVRSLGVSFICATLARSGSRRGNQVCERVVPASPAQEPGRCQASTSPLGEGRSVSAGPGNGSAKQQRPFAAVASAPAVLERRGLLRRPARVRGTKTALVMALRVSAVDPPPDDGLLQAGAGNWLILQRKMV